MFWVHLCCQENKRVRVETQNVHDIMVNQHFNTRWKLALIIPGEPAGLASCKIHLIEIKCYFTRYLATKYLHY